MIDGIEGFARARTLRWVVLIVAAAIGCRLAYIQILDSKYKDMARNNVLRYVVQYPARGEVFDRRGEFLVQSKECYDLMVVRKDMAREGFDTVAFCNVVGVKYDRLRRMLDECRLRPRAPRLVAGFLPAEVKLQLDEMNVSGFYTVSRTIRQYPRNIGGNLLGSIGQISPARLERQPEYRAGDYIGTEGLEDAYEEVLRGRKGVKIQQIDAGGAIKGSYMNGMFDSLPVAGSSIVCTIDARLQLLAEELMQGKVGAVVAIEPSTGEILVMASSPTFDPDQMVGRQRGNHYMELLRDPRNPLFNRSVKAKYPPGSTFKVVQGLIGLQEGVLTPHNAYGCHRGYNFGRIHVGCHEHPSPLELRDAVATSCNAYFCYVFRNILENRKYDSMKDAYDVWRDYVLSFGFGRKLDSDFRGEGSGNVPTREFYDKRYRGSWNSLTVLSLAIGQGELGCTPLQMANLAAIVANRGYYYIPHIVRSVEGVDSLDGRFYRRQYTKVAPEHFEPIVDGMWRSVNVWGTSRLAYLEGLDVCGKTGTAQNPRGADHSTFLSFAPRDNPRIAISVYVENGGFGAAIALPIASLIEEYYLTDTIRRPWLMEMVKNKQIYYPSYAKR